VSFPCDPCTCDCTLATFDGTSFTGTTTTGSPSASGGVWHLSSGDRVIVNNGPLTALQPDYWTFTLYDAGADTSRAYIAWQDADNNLFLEFATDTSTATMRAGRTTDGVEEYLSAAVTLDDTDFSGRPTIRVCWTPETSIASTSGSQGSYGIDAVGIGWTDPQDAEGAPDSNGANYFDGPSPFDTTSLLLLTHLDLPVGATITGMQATVSAATDSDGTTLTVFQAFVDGSPAGSDHSAGETVNDGSFADISEGGVGDDWGASLTWIDARTLGFAVAFNCSPAVPGGDVAVDVDAISCLVYYDVPARIHGTLRGSYENTTSPNRKQCVTVKTETTSTGKAAGVAVVSGTAEIDDATFSYGYSAIRPDCPACDCDVETVDNCDCCAEGFEAAETMIVDFTGSLTDGSCDYCDEIDGPYSLPTAGPCSWQGTFPLSACHGVDATLTLTLKLLDDGAGSCQWWLQFEVSDPFPAFIPPNALYRSASLASNHDCQTTATLSLVASTPGDPCDGSWPATVDVSV